ncbi:lisH domain-containing protein FOPNL-like [Asterias rubens]|uniref:lisH domain-containing protein FOPNL-like n=1 Tax=Asterias rubens TaxID=7604 RepID=UPI0014557D9E|nr:lisH domain-containing protein FOPNL-like [Asterias rubens]
MTSVQELKAVLKETLESRGVMGQIKARVRSEVFHALDDQSDPRPPLSNENMLINELIREYLEFNKYKYTSSVLTAESGQPQTPLDREFLVNELNITEDRDTASVPLLYSILSHFVHSKKSLPSRDTARSSKVLNTDGRHTDHHRVPMATQDGVYHGSHGEPLVFKGGRR